MNENLITEIVACITEAADELLFLENRNEIQQGQLLAYAESLSIIRDALAGYDLTAVGLDFDIDERSSYFRIIVESYTQWWYDS